MYYVLFQDMGLTKQYLRYAAAEVFGVIAGNKSNIAFLHLLGSQGKYCATGACEDVIIWDIRSGEKVCMNILYDKTSVRICYQL